MISSSPSFCEITNEASKTRQKSLNFLQKLHLREIRGCLQTHHSSKPLQLFHTLPKRLKFPLHKLIQYSDFTDGHIFLGFTKDGQFVISYAVQMELVLFPLPTYTYTLYFWRFVPHKPLKKVSEIQLFRKYEIQSELLINVCQWPLDNSRILVHGFSPLGDQEHRTVQNPCYLTIAAIPPIQTCQECKASVYSFDADEEDEDWDSRQAACLTHGFVLHVQYDLVPPFPKFNPRVSLTKDGRVVINTGDSLIALSITTDCQEDVLGLPRSPASAIEGAAGVVVPSSRDPILSPCRSESSDGAVSVSSPAAATSLFDHVRAGFSHYAGSVDSPRSFAWKTSSCSPSIEGDRSPPSVTVATSSEFNVSIDGHYASAGIPLPSDVGSAVASASSSPVIELFASPVRKIRHHKLLSAVASAECEPPPLFDGGRPCDISSEVTHSEWEFAEEGQQEKGGGGGGSCPLHTYSRNAPATADDAGNHRLETSFVNSQNLGRGGGFVVGRVGGHDDESVKENLSPAAVSNLHLPPVPAAGHRHLGKTVSTEAVPAGAGGSNGGGGKPSDVTTRPGSPESGTLVTQHSTAGCVVRVNQVFVPCIDVLLMEGEDEDVGNSAYQNSLSLAVYWPSSTPLIPCPTRLLEDVKGPVLVVKQAIFDVEQYLHEMAQRLCSEAGQKYQAFTDYDIQILDVFEETSDVLALAVMLIQAAPKNKGLIKNHRNSSGVTRKQYETGFKFLWNIQTGKCQTVDTEMLREDDTKVASYSQRSWNPGRKKCTLLQQKWSHPCASTQEVLVLSNEPVFSGVPIDIFYSPGGDVAVERAHFGGSS